jgi:hypothetical protein
VTCSVKTLSEAGDTGLEKVMRSSPLMNTSAMPQVICPSPPAPLPAQPRLQETIWSPPPPEDEPEQALAQNGRQAAARAAREWGRFIRDGADAGPWDAGPGGGPAPTV